MKRIIAVLAAIWLAAAVSFPIASAVNQSGSNKCEINTSDTWYSVNIAINSNGSCSVNRGESSSYSGSYSRSTTIVQNNTSRSWSYSESSIITNIPAKTDLYVALGDSVAAGAGLNPPSHASAYQRTCGLSEQAYPSIVADSLNRPYRNLACGGTTIADIKAGRAASADTPPQLKEAFSEGVPGLITITAGANDIRWTQFAQKCYRKDCGTLFDEAAVSALRTALGWKLERVLNTIDRRSGGKPPRVIVTGYYNPLSDNCSGQGAGVNSMEREWFGRQVERLNKTIESAVGDYRFARFAAIDFSGHGMCSEEPWIQGPDDAAPFHPTARGQQAIAQAVLGHVR